jgi:hypothetical protein
MSSSDPNPEIPLWSTDIQVGKCRPIVLGQESSEWYHIIYQQEYTDPKEIGNFRLEP